MLLTVVAKLAVVCMPGPKATGEAAAAAAAATAAAPTTATTTAEDQLLAQELTAPPADQQQQQQLDAVLCQMLPAALKQLDLAAMMGGLRFRPLLDEAIALLDQQLLLLLGKQQGDSAAGTAAAGIGITQAQAQDTGAVAGADIGRALQEGLSQGISSTAATAGLGGDEEEALQYAKRRRVQEPAAAAADANPSNSTQAPEAQQQQQQSGEQLQEWKLQQLPAGSLSAASAVVPVERCPSLELFMMKYMLAEGESNSRGAKQMPATCSHGLSLAVAAWFITR
jgi:hypothetical protein